MHTTLGSNVSFETFKKVISIIPCQPIFASVYLFGSTIKDSELFFKDKNINFDNRNGVEVSIIGPTKGKLLEIYKQDLSSEKLPRASFKEAKFYYNKLGANSIISFDLTPYSLTVNFHNGKGITEAVTKLCKQLFETKMKIVINKAMEDEYLQPKGILTTTCDVFNDGNFNNDFKNQFE